MSSSGLNVGTRVYLKRRELRPESRHTQLRNVHSDVRKIIELVREEREKGARKCAETFDRYVRSSLFLISTASLVTEFRIDWLRI